MSSKLPVQTLIQIALEMNLPDLVNFCAQSRHILDNVCLKDRFWLVKLEKDFPGYPMVRASPSENYVLLYQLTRLAKKHNWKGHRNFLSYSKLISICWRMQMPKMWCFNDKKNRNNLREM